MEPLPRFLDLPTRSFFLFGPRGTGKSTWLRHKLPDALVVDLLRADVLRPLLARPERLRELVAAHPAQTAVVLDEVQRAPELLPVVHELVEREPARQFVLAGSSARKLRRQSSDLLGGRASHRTMHPFMAAEWPRFRLESALREGLVPLVVRAAEPADALAAYVMLYLDQEVRHEGLVRNVGAFARVLEVVSFSHGSLLNVANVAREAAVERKTVAGYLEVLEDLLLSFTLPVFTRRARRATSVHPKFYLFDAGVFRSLRPKGPLDPLSEMEGPALEGLVAQHLRAWIAYSRTDARLHFWRTRSGVEVDFVVYGADGLWAIDVQSSRDVRPADLRALETFREDYPEATAILLHRGDDRLVRNGVWCVPVTQFLEGLTPRAPLDAGVVPSRG